MVNNLKERVESLIEKTDQRVFELELTCLMKELIENAADTFEGMKGEEFKLVASIWRGEGESN